MDSSVENIKSLRAENAELRARLEEAEEHLEAIRSGEVEALVIGEQVYLLESAEAASNRFRGNVLEQINDIVFAVDADDRLIYLNPPAERKYGVRSSDVLGEKLDDLFAVRWESATDESAWRRSIENRGNWRGENVHITRDGEEFYAESMIGKLFDAERRYTGKMAVIRDITSRKRVEEELRTAREELEQRVRHRTHELAETYDALRREMEERSKLEKLRTELLERIVTSEEEERGRIARDIHDQLGQRVTALRLQIANLIDNGVDPEKLPGQVELLRRTAMRLDSEISFLAWELRPAALDDLGLPDAAAAFLEDWSHNYKISSDFNLQGFGEKRLDPTMETQLYRIMQEALNNIAKHSKASRVNVLLSWNRDEVSLVVEDNGHGFDAAAMENPRGTGKGFGLMSMRERASLVGGKIEIESGEGTGTTVYARFPVP
jgi:PAS domain S-box-containing protein